MNPVAQSRQGASLWGVVPHCVCSKLKIIFFASTSRNARCIVAENHECCRIRFCVVFLLRSGVVGTAQLCLFCGVCSLVVQLFQMCLLITKTRQSQLLRASGGLEW